MLSSLSSPWLFVFFTTLSLTKTTFTLFHSSLGTPEPEPQEEHIDVEVDDDVFIDTSESVSLTFTENARSQSLSSVPKPKSDEQKALRKASYTLSCQSSGITHTSCLCQSVADVHRDSVLTLGILLRNHGTPSTQIKS